MIQNKLSIVIPAHNEEKNIVRTVNELCAAVEAENIPYEIILVNDNSTDNTREIIADLMKDNGCIRTVNRMPPEGFGRAIRSGLEVAEGDVVVICMADCSDSPQDVVKYYRKIEEGYDCVFGSRFIKGSNVVNYPKLKLVVNRIVNKCIQFMFRCKYNDLTNAFKAYRMEVISTCGPYSSCHFNITLELSLSALIRKYNIAEIPISWYGRTWGSSDLSLRKMGRRYLEVLLKIYTEKLLISDDIEAERVAAKRKYETNIHNISIRLKAIENRVEAIESKNVTASDFTGQDE
ncbi:MAG: glycosyltransferase family 2 protein [Candidatus Anammoxibacter sp.]